MDKVNIKSWMMIKRKSFKKERVKKKSSKTTNNNSYRCKSSKRPTVTKMTKSQRLTNKSNR